MLFLLLCNHRTLLQLKENIEWENCAGLDLWCQHSLPQLRLRLQASFQVSFNEGCWLMLTFIPGPHNSTVLWIVNIATSGLAGVCELYPDCIKTQTCVMTTAGNQDTLYRLYTGSSWQSLDIYEDETWRPWGAVTMSGSSTVTMILSWVANTTHLSLLLFLELDLNLNKKCQFPVIIPLFTVHVQGNKNLNTIETLDSKYKTFCEGFINVTGNSHWKYKLVI